MFLELAENAYNYDAPYLSDHLSQAGEDSPYIFVPGVPGEEGVYVREDYFDDLPDEDWEQLMGYLEGAQQGVGFLMFGKKARARRAVRRAKKRAAKLERVTVRAEGGGPIARLTAGIANIIRPQEGPPPDPSTYPPRIRPRMGAVFGGQIGTPPPRKINWMPIIIGGVALVIVGGALLARRRR